MSMIPTLEEIAVLVLARTVDRSGNRGIFTTQTKPTAEQVEAIIKSVRTRVLGSIGANFDTAGVLVTDEDGTVTLGDVLRETIALGAAARIEASVEPESASTTDSAYTQLNQSFLEGLKTLQESTTEDPGDPQSMSTLSVASPTLAAASRFPQAIEWTEICV